MGKVKRSEALARVANDRNIRPTAPDIQRGSRSVGDHARKRTPLKLAPLPYGVLQAVYGSSSQQIGQIASLYVHLSEIAQASTAKMLCLRKCYVAAARERELRCDGEVGHQTIAEVHALTPLETRQIDRRAFYDTQESKCQRAQVHAELLLMVWTQTRNRFCRDVSVQIADQSSRRFF